MSTRHWKRLPLSEIAEVRLGRQRSPKRAVGPNMRPYMRAANVTWNGISLHDVKEMDFTPEEFETYALRRGDLLLSEASGSASEVGKPAVWNDEVRDCCFQNTLIRVRAPEPLVPFLHLHFYKDALTGEFARAARGVGIHHLGAKTLSQWQIHLPPLDEQRRIVDTVHSYFRRLDTVTAALKRVRHNLKRYRASILKAAVEGRLVPTEAALARAEGRAYEPATALLQRILADRRRNWEEAELARMSTAGTAPKTDRWKKRYREPAAPDASALPPLPEGWCWASADSLGGVQLGRQRSPKDHHGPNMRPYLRVANVFEDRLDLSDVLEMHFSSDEVKRYELRSGDILLNEGQSPRLVGRPAMYGGEVTGACFQNTLIRFRACGELDASYALIVFRAQLHALRYMRIATITTNIAHLSATRFATVEFPLPPLAEQRRIVAAVQAMSSRIDDLLGSCDRSLTRCQQARQPVLRSAFAGRFDESSGFGEDPTSARTQARGSVTHQENGS